MYSFQLFDIMKTYLCYFYTPKCDEGQNGVLHSLSIFKSIGYDSSELQKTYVFVPTPVLEMEISIYWSESNSWIYYYIILNQKVKIDWSVQRFPSVGLENRCSLWGLLLISPTFPVAVKSHHPCCLIPDSVLYACLLFIRPSRDGLYYVIGYGWRWAAGGRPHRFPHDNFSSVYRIFTKLGHMIPLWKGKNPIYFGVIRSKVKVTITINIIFDNRIVSAR